MKTRPPENIFMRTSICANMVVIISYYGTDVAGNKTETVIELSLVLC